MAQAFLVVGPEGSGTRWVTSLFISAGCYGDAGHEQRMDIEIPAPTQNVVFRRSFPHGEDYPNMFLLLNKFRDYDSRHLIICMRDIYSVVMSQIDNRFASSVGRAYRRIGEAYGHIFHAYDWLSDAIFNYEMAMMYKEPYVNRFMSRFSLQTEGLIEFNDGNAKYYR